MKHINPCEETVHQYEERINKLIKLWIQRAEDCEKDKFSQSEDYREASVWRRAANELEIYLPTNNRLTWRP